MQLEDYRWYVVQTAPRQEAAAALDLRRRGYRTLYLHHAEWRERGNKSVLVRKPLLRGYLFLGLAPDQFAGDVPLLHLANGAIGVSRNGVVRSPGGFPLSIPPELIRQIAAKVDYVTGKVEEDEPTPQVEPKPGWKAKLGDSTPYYGFIGEIERIAPNQNLSILIASFGRTVRMTVRQDQVDELISPKGETVTTVQTG